MLNGNKTIIGLAIAGVIAVSVSLGTLIDTKNASAIATHVETSQSIAAPAESTRQAEASPSATATKINTPKNVLFLNSVVEEFSVNSLITQLQALEGSKEPIYLLIDSPGGSVFDGARLITQMESMKTPVNTVCVGLCASMGAMIHSYGKLRLITNRSTLMYHPASGGAQGQIQNMQTRINYVLQFVGKLEANVQKRSGMAKETYDRRIAYEMWVDSDDAKALHLVDDVVSLNVTLPPPSDESALQRAKHRSPVRDFDLYWIFDRSGKYSE